MIHATLGVIIVTIGALSAETLPPRSAGELDIHHIVTGLGDQTLFVLPDGTTLLVDTGDVDVWMAEIGREQFWTRPRPNAALPAGAWVARYIERVTSAKKLDYLLSTHLHPDHINGLGDVTSAIEVDLVLDRAWPDYESPVRVLDALLSRYREAVDGLTVNRFEAGRADQIVLRRDASAYPAFEVRNLTANGEYWTGEGDETRTRFPPRSELAEEDYPTENMCSASFLMRYGAFSYYTGGDLTGVPRVGHPVWQNMEAAIAEAVGPIDVHAVNHHGGRDAASVEFLKEIRPRVHIISSIAPPQAFPTTLDRLFSQRVYSGERDVFALQYREEAKVVYGFSPPNLQSESGHVVVRVAKGGATYQVFVVSDADESGTVLSTHGPYPSRAQE